MIGLSVNLHELQASVNWPIRFINESYGYSHVFRTGL